MNLWTFQIVLVCSLHLSIWNRNGLNAILQSIPPTCMGYFLQGGCKFGFYEYFKSICCRVFDLSSDTLPGDAGHAFIHRIPTLIACSGAAELIASVCLCPLEVTKIYILSNPEIGRSGMLRRWPLDAYLCCGFFSVGMITTMLNICRENGPLGLFKGNLTDDLLTA